MTDIITRLLDMSEAMWMDRSQDELDALLLEAKEEIERLRTRSDNAEKAIEAVWRCGLVIESSVRRGDGPIQYAEVVEALKLVKKARAALAPQQKGNADGK